MVKAGGGSESSKPSSAARVAMMELANMMSVPMSLNAVVALNVPETIWAGGANIPLSAAEILSRLRRPSPPADPDNLQRILRLLAAHNVFREHAAAASTPRKYSLTEIGLTLVATGEDGVSYGAYVLQHHQEALLRAWPLLRTAVEDPTEEPFVRANSNSAYGYYGERPEMNELMQRAMTGVSAPFMETVLHGYGTGFAGIRRLVDVGGSSGACLRLIMDKYPNVEEGINFDLPEVVARAPDLPGITHVGGDMFKSIPGGDAIFMKWVLTTWTDDECKLILKNCFDALPEGGKLIACEPVLPEDVDSSSRTRALLEGDIFVMTIYRAKGKERTEEEFRQLGLAVGFSIFKAFYDLDHFYTLLEFQK